MNNISKGLVSNMDIRGRLKEWGEWQRSLQGVGLASGLIGMYDEPMPPCTGDGVDNARAGKLDMVIARMMKKNYDYYEVLSSKYIWDKSIAHIARDMQLSQATVKNIRNAAEAHVAGVLDLVECPKKDIYRLHLIG